MIFFSGMTKQNDTKLVNMSPYGKTRKKYITTSDALKYLHLFYIVMYNQVYT